VSSLSVKIFSAITNLLTIPLILNHLGEERYGLWMSISSIISFLSFTDLGLGKGLLNSISIANAKNNIKEAQIAVSTIFFLLIGVVFILFILFFTFYSFIPWDKIFNVRSINAIEDSSPTVVVIFSFFVINIPLGLIQRIQEGYQEGFKLQLWLLLGSVFSFIGVLLCIHFESSLPFLVFINSAGQTLAIIINGLVLFNIKRPYLKPNLKYFDFKVGKKLISLGVVFLFISISTLIANNSDNIIIAQLLNTSSVTNYEIVKKLFFLTMVTSYFISPLLPAFTDSIEKGDFIWAKKTYKKTIILSTLFTSIISLPILLFGQQFIKLWIKSDFIPSWSLFLGFYLYIVLNNLIGIISTFLSNDKLIIKILIPITLTTLFSFLFKILFIKSFGLSGIIWATILSWSIFFILPCHFVIRTIFKHNSHKYE
jgi:O-antigen/teichoic acid export membrane protein